MANLSISLRRCSALFLGLLATASSAQAQQKFSGFHFSGGYGRLAIERDFKSTIPVTAIGQKTEEIVMYGGAMGVDPALVHLSDEMTFGLSLNIGLWALSKEYTGSGLDAPLLLTLPEYATFRYGAHSSRKSQQNFGVGVGLGYRFGFVLAPKCSAPSVMIEGAYAGKRRDWMLRFSTDLTKAATKNPEENPNIEELRLGMLSLTIGATM